MIVTQNLSKSYGHGQGQVEALRSINLEVEQGENVALVGPSGAGKSSLLYLIGLMDAPTGGDVQLFGRSTAALADVERSRLRGQTLGFVFQSFNLLPQLSAWENVALPLRYARVSARDRRRRSFEMLERVGLLDRASHRPSELSGGQEQRVAVARALVTHPRVVLADEPTGNLDRASGAVVLELLDLAHRDGATLITVTHSAEVASRASRIITIVDGQVSDDTLTNRDVTNPLRQS